MKKHFGKQYLNRAPTIVEREAIAEAMAAKGFPGCIASWDCKHFVWMAMGWLLVWGGSRLQESMVLLIGYVGDEQPGLYPLTNGLRLTRPKTL